MIRTSGRLSLDFARCAEKRIKLAEGRVEADLRRATSDLYYALFHAVCEELAGLIALGEPATEAMGEQYRLLYRLPNHGQMQQRCREGLSRVHFSRPQKAFMELLISMKAKRDAVDYDPLARWNISEVENDLKRTQYTLESFFGLGVEERKHVALFLAVDGKRSK
jgi:hypothetical protein